MLICALLRLELALVTDHDVGRTDGRRDALRTDSRSAPGDCHRDDLVDLLGEVGVVGVQADEEVAGDLVVLVGAADRQLGGLPGLAET